MQKTCIKWSHLEDLEIADVDEEQVTMLIGANVPEAQVHEKCRRWGSVEPYAVRTLLGWSVLGPVDAANILCSQAKNVSFVKYGDGRLDQQMKQFLRLEDILRKECQSRPGSTEKDGKLSSCSRWTLSSWNVMEE